MLFSSLSLYTTQISPSASTSKFIAAAANNTTTVLVSTSSSSGDDSDDVSSSRRGTGTTARRWMLLKVEDMIRKKGRDFHKAKTGSVVLANTSMEYNPFYDADKGFNIIP
nr:hypothetical protein [Tanacetum cinerariifolium]